MNTKLNIFDVIMHLTTFMMSCCKCIMYISSNAYIFYILKITSSKFQEMLIKASSLLECKYLNFDLVCIKVPFT